MARVSLLDREWLEPGEEAPVRLTLPQPIGALARDRIVLRDTAATCTIGGGVVLDPFPPRRGRRTPQRLAQLHALKAGDPADALRRLLGVAPGWTDQPAFMRAHNVLQADWARLIAAVSAVAAGGLILSSSAFDGVCASTLEVLEAHHRASPELPGLQKDRLRLALAGSLADSRISRDFRGVAKPRGARSGWPLVPAAWPSHQPVPPGRETMASGAAVDRGRAVPSTEDPRYRSRAKGARSDGTQDAEAVGADGRLDRDLPRQLLPA